MRSWVWWGVCLSLGAMALLYGYRARFETFLSTPLDLSHEPRIFVVSDDSSVSDVLVQLAQQGLIRKHSEFSALVGYIYGSSELVAGEYNLSSAMTPLQQLEKMRRGDVVKHTLSLRAGVTLSHVAQLLDQLQIVAEETFLHLAKQPAFLAELGVDAPSAEGYIYPDVWFLSKDMDVEELLELFVKKFVDNSTCIKERAIELGLRPYEIVALASLIERSVVNPQQWRVYSALLHERLRLGYPLQHRAADDYHRVQHEIDPNEKYIWDTSNRAGLPDTPIGSPSTKAILAACHPLPGTKPLYLVATEGTLHIFCADFECYQASLLAHDPLAQPTRLKRLKR